MSPVRSSLYFFGVAIPLYIILMVVPRHGLERMYASWFWKASETCFRRIGTDGFTRFGSAANPTHVPTEVRHRVLQGRRGTEHLDTLVLIGSTRGGGEYGTARASSQLIAYFPSAFSFVLFASTPIRLKRRLLALVIGFSLTHLFIAFRMYIWLIQLFCAGPNEKKGAYVQYEPSAFWFARLDELKDFIHSNPTVSYIAPVMIWIGVLLVLGELQTPFQAPPTKSVVAVAR